MRRRMQMIFQDPMSSLDPRQNVESILLPRACRRTASATDRGATGERSARDARRGRPAAAALRRYPHEFSGGQRQRIGIARALVLEPGPDRRRRAGVRARRVDPGAGDQPAGRAAGRARPDLPGDRARPGRGAAHLRQGRRDVPGRAGRGGAQRRPLRRAAAPVHQGAACRRCRCRTRRSRTAASGSCSPATCRRRRTRRRAAGSTPAARGAQPRPGATTSGRSCARSRPGHRVACHWAEDIRSGKLSAHRVEPEVVSEDVLAPGAVPDLPGSVTEILGR